MSVRWINQEEVGAVGQPPLWHYDVVWEWNGLRWIRRDARMLQRHPTCSSLNPISIDSAFWTQGIKLFQTWVWVEKYVGVQEQFSWQPCADVTPNWEV